MKIKVKFMSSETIELEIDSLDLNVLNLKEKIAEIKNSSTDLIRLIFSGKILEDSKSLNSYNIKEDLTVICLITKKKITEKPSSQNENNSTSDITDNTNGTTTDSSSNLDSIPNFNGMPGGMPNFSGMPGGMPNFSGMPGGMPNLGSIPGPENIQMLRTLIQNPQMSQMMNVIMQNPQMRDYMVNSTLQNMNIPQDSPMRAFYENTIVSLFNNPDQYLNIIDSFSQMPQFSNMYNNSNTTNSFSQMPNFPNLNEVNNSNNSNIDNNQMPTYPNINEDNNSLEENNLQTTETINETQNSTEISKEELKEKYADQIDQIKSMGFEDEDKIIEVLAQSSGSVSIALNKLFT